MIVSENVIQKVNGHNIAAPKGFSAGGIHCGIKHKKLDLGLIVSDVQASAAAVYTTNQIQAAPLTVTKESISKEQLLQTVIVNSGNANACTGTQGMADAYEMRSLVSQKLGISDHLTAVASTGVIGEMLPMDTVRSGIQSIQADSTLKSSIDFSQSILTTDKVMKNTTYRFEVDGKEVTISGTAKGSGMIHPNMATMLGFVTTDASIEPEALHEALKNAVDRTFNCITVDGDTSTNDMVLILANGCAENSTLKPGHKDWGVFQEALRIVCEDLGKMIAKDGEGATKLIETKVTGTATDEDARKIAKTIVGSPLVKTAVFGCDANWGRVMAAVGYSGVPIDIGSLEIYIGPVCVVKEGMPVSFSEQDVIDYLKHHEILIEVKAGNLEGYGTAWGCDLTYDYVQINASYRT
ncbi:bifunctional ornithine acetyltransferase/N-acetylglutamate synthase [Fictibacillus aquaticus]|uniref:Arginine biosynthesis bifunctional protein ArgJ n=1 Tax=Fictibacillus aquaticus TaxID=2021314 RepID=A0A235F4X3_9BACL|nr:bifunctional ornithine acetyltransferase/N-acetylglutamate synthase [Fictibacillus aquaticus]OYD56346.1 bifunctional ornithine acetyltransferase/N-acetylglutamate synthase [Fictibacillus aquaticus]